MSVNYTAILGFGWIIPNDLYSKIQKIDNFEEIEEYFYYINCYSDNSDVFCGKIIECVDPGNCIEVPNTDTDIQVPNLKLLLSDIGEPQLYLLNRIS